MSLRKDVESWITSEAADRVADYASRGRKHQHLTDELLTAQWRDAFKLMADDVRDYDRRTAAHDFKAEFVLRKMEPPYDLVRDDFERYVAETDRAIAELRANDPAQYEKMTRGVNENLEAFRSTRAKSKS